MIGAVVLMFRVNAETSGIHQLLEQMIIYTENKRELQKRIQGKNIKPASKRQGCFLTYLSVQLLVNRTLSAPQHVSLGK